nr:class I SAM-dependent methyltransferase [Paenibacillus sp. An7]
MIPNYSSVLDAGCGHGEFTLKMSKYTNNIIGFDNSQELIKIAHTLLQNSSVKMLTLFTLQLNRRCLLKMASLI